MSAVSIMESGSVGVHARFDIPDYKFMRDIKVEFRLRSVNEVVFTVVKSWIVEKQQELLSINEEKRNEEENDK